MHTPCFFNTKTLTIHCSEAISSLYQSTAMLNPFMRLISHSCRLLYNHVNYLIKKRINERPHVRSLVDIAEFKITAPHFSWALHKIPRRMKCCKMRFSMAHNRCGYVNKKALISNYIGFVFT